MLGSRLTRYVGEGEAISFWELAERARLLGEVALGWRTAADDIEINPPNKVGCFHFAFPVFIAFRNVSFLHVPLKPPDRVRLSVRVSIHLVLNQELRGNRSRSTRRRSELFFRFAPLHSATFRKVFCD